ncbi:hypothetical protein LTR41_000895 [Exophiala xenobiotica]|nr:hypothetical protein LTR41_000895 [Exophiala xenobiotica]
MQEPRDHPGTAPQSIPGLSEEESQKAAILIQAVRDAQYHQLTTPRAPRPTHDIPEEETHHADKAPSSPARTKWFRATGVARRAGADDHSPSVSDVSSDELNETEETKKKRAAANEVRKKNAKMMDLQYFLEMVDQKHRYGSNLRKYHSYWKTQDTDQNFFYWLDQGDGRNVDLPERSRARLDKEQVRYLSREERLNYLVKVNKQGLLVWAKNGELVWTKDELFRDSVNGIVPVDDPAPTWRYNVPPPDRDQSDHSSSGESSVNDSEDNTSGDEGERYVNEDASSPVPRATKRSNMNRSIAPPSQRGRKNQACFCGGSIQPHDQDQPQKGS